MIGPGEEYSELKNMTPMMNPQLLGYGSGVRNSAGSLVKTANFNKESTQLRKIEYQGSFINSNGGGQNDSYNRHNSQLLRLELNDSSMIDKNALVVQRRKEDSTSRVEQSGIDSNAENGVKKTFVSNL